MFILNGKVWGIVKNFSVSYFFEEEGKKTMETLYHTANAPRMNTDQFFTDAENQAVYDGMVKRTADFLEENQLLDPVLWKRFVDQFRGDTDFDGGWRCEYWGKMMRGACFVYSCSHDPKLYQILTDTICDMLSVQEKDGRISSYGRSHEFEAWDIWGRKYVLLGMQYFLEICTDKLLSDKITDSMCRQMDYIISKVGKPEDGKILITKATRHWRGLNSSSLLEPVVRLYSITGEQKYLDFAGYIVECGGTDVADIFELAYENQLFPFQYPVTKAYEMMSCFEGLLEYYRVTGIDKYKQSVIRFADKILESDFTIIGSCGCTHELFDHSAVRQANTNNEPLAQETCVTVTLMKLLYQLSLLTGDSKYADAFEISFYNGYLGAVNSEHCIENSLLQEHPDWIAEPLPFDSYSPLTAGTRGKGIGGLMVMADRHYYGCCACIGAAGLGLFQKISFLTSKAGFVFQMYQNGNIKAVDPCGENVDFEVQTAYPKSGKIDITLHLQKKHSFEIKFRIPQWADTVHMYLNGVPCQVTKGYTAITREWEDGDQVELVFEMPVRILRPVSYGHQVLMNKVVWGANYMVPTYDEEDPMAKHHFALQRGPLVLAQENRLGYSVDVPVNIREGEKGCAIVREPEVKQAPYENILELAVLLDNGEEMHVTDYASAGKGWNEESKMAAWMLCD